MKKIAGTLDALSMPLIGGGLGLILRGAFEDKFKKDQDKVLRDHLLSWAPLAGTMGGLMIGGPRTYYSIVDAVKPFVKTSELNEDVKLRPHQKRSIDKLLENNGRALMAHGTGTGKTLTGIAGFEKMKEQGNAKRALVVVPSSLRDNFSDSIKRFTDSTFSVIGPKNETKTLNPGDKADTDYVIVGYELFRQNKDAIMDAVGADTLIIDEVHRTRNDEGVTYEALTDASEKVKNVITLTGSIVNNEPADVVPLMDVTYGKKGHGLGTKQLFEKLFVNKTTKTEGFFRPKVTTEKGLKNKEQLSKFLSNKIDYVPHSELEEFMPRKKETIIRVPMTEHQTQLYNYSMDSLDPLTRWKIKNNIPLPQREISGLFGKLMKTRQISTDPSIMDETLKNKSPLEYSPKVKKVVEDLEDHLALNPNNRVLIYGNLVEAQLNTVAKALKDKSIEFGKFMGSGQEGSSTKLRTKDLKDFKAGKNRVLLISSAGGEGLDLPEATMLQMLEGHYNPEKIQQAEARIRRVANTPQKDREVEVRKYISTPAKPEGIGSTLRKGLGFLLGGSTNETGIDEWIYTVASKKDSLNKEFRNVLDKDPSIRSYTKTAGFFDTELPRMADTLFTPLNQYDPYERSRAEDVASRANLIFSPYLADLGDIPAEMLARRIAMEPARRIKQRILELGDEELITKKHYDKVLNKAKIDERLMEVGVGTSVLGHGLAMLAPDIAAAAAGAIARASGSGILGRIGDRVNSLGGRLAMGAGISLAIPTVRNLLMANIMASAADNPADLDRGINMYLEDRRKKMEKKYKSSNKFINEFDTRERLGIDTALM